MSFKAVSGTPDIKSQTLEFALASAGVGMWDVELVAPWTVNWDDRCKELFGIAKGNTIPYAEAIKSIHEDDRIAVDNAVKRALEPGSNGLTYRTVGIDDQKIRWVNFIGKAHFDENNVAYRFVGIARDQTDERVLTNDYIETKSNFRTIVEQAPMAIGLLQGPDMIIRTVNNAFLHAWGKSEMILGLPIIEAMPELKGQPLIEMLESVYRTGLPQYKNATKAVLLRKGILEDVYFDFVYTPTLNTENEVSGVMILASIVTEQVIAKQKLKATEANLRDAVEVAELGTWDLDPGSGKFGANERLKNWFGIPADNEVLLTTALDIILESDQVRVTVAIEEALKYSSGGNYDIQYTIVNPVSHQARIVRARGKTSFNEDKTPFRLNGTLQDITEQMSYQKKIEESVLYTNNIFYNSPVAKVVFTGTDMVIRSINENMLNMLGRDASVIGKPFMEAVPELIATPLMERLQHVFTTGETYNQPEEKLFLLKHGQPTIGYYNYIYKPLSNTDNEIYGIICSATDVTEQTLIRKQVEKAEANLRDAIKIAQLGTWSFDIEKRDITYSQEMLDWYGFDTGQIYLSDILSAIVEKDRERLRSSFEITDTLATNAIYNDEYSIINRRTGAIHIIQSISKMVLNENGIAVKIDGTARDVTTQRLYEFALEDKVLQGREDLAAVNEELQSNNEELITLNEELEESNNMLLKSNYELEQYAYVASHDLQEPLRKIRVYSSMMSEKGGFGEEHHRTVSKINRAAERMSLLIKNLLEFSRLIKSETIMGQVSLLEIVNLIAEDFELTIEEKNAHIEISKLPSIEASGLQMNQLFYNLMSNALKFVKVGITPYISISNRLIKSSELLQYIPKPLTYSNYYLISVTDNGIGFEPKYAEKIFDVFKRLHAQEIYAGSGIGLSLCRRIVTNHQGYIAAISEPGKGTTFNIILPDRQ
jgi:signal transduction histidine kinase